MAQVTDPIYQKTGSKAPTYACGTATPMTAAFVLQSIYQLKDTKSLHHSQGSE